jgi:polygalacturonase
MTCSSFTAHCPRIGLLALLVQVILTSQEPADATPIATHTEHAASTLDASTVPVIALPHTDGSRVYEIRDFGALGNGTVNDTAAINKAIEACSGAGGGTVHVPAGVYVAASIHLKSNIRIMLDRDATITGDAMGFDAPERNDFDRYQDFGHSHFHNALMWGEGIENVSIIGGTINGGHIAKGDVKPGRGDKVIAIRSGRRILFDQVTHETGGHFVYLLNDCDQVTFSHIVIKDSRDAVDLMGCRNVQIHGCSFTGCGDDTLGIKSDYALGRKIGSENIYAWDCYFESECNGIQFGSETAGDFRNIRAWNITIGKAWKAGIGITSMDGGIIDDVIFSDFKIAHATNPIFMMVTDRLRTGEHDPHPGTIKNITLRNVAIGACIDAKWGHANPVTISGLAASHVQGIHLENVSIIYRGGGTSDQGAVIPKYIKGFAPADLGVLPAAAFFIRHVDDLTLRNVTLEFTAADQRSLFVAKDVNGLSLDGVSAPPHPGSSAFQLDHVRKLSVRNCHGFPATIPEAVESGEY